MSIPAKPLFSLMRRQVKTLHLSRRTNGNTCQWPIPPDGLSGLNLIHLQTNTYMYCIDILFSM